MSLSSEISTWQAQDLSGSFSIPTLLGGLASASWSHATNSSGGTTSPGRTFLFLEKPLSAGTITDIKFYSTTSNGSAWKIKVFRWDAGNSWYEMIAEESVAVPLNANGQIVSKKLNFPITVSAGDVLGIFVPYGVDDSHRSHLGMIAEAESGDLDTYYVTGDVTTHDAFSGDHFGYWPEFQATYASNGVHGAGLPYSQWTRATSVSGGYDSPGRTFIFPARSFRQAGTVTDIVLNVAICRSTGWKFKVFRWNGSTYTYVGESTFSSFTKSAGDQILELSSPITVQVGDIPGLFLPYAAADPRNQLGAQLDAATLPMRYVTGDITSSDSFASTAAALPNLEAFMQNPPFIAIIGDSKAEGHNNGGATSADSYHTEFHDTTVVNTLPGGTLSSEILYELAQLQAMNYQNIGKGSQTFSNLADTYAAIALATCPQVLLIECGVNDVIAARSWGDVEDDLDTIYAMFQASNSELLLIDEILPWTNGTEAQAETIRTWNGYLATWASGKTGVSVVSTYDEMKDPESEDDMLAAYDFDGVHLTTAGVAFLADLILDHLLDLYAAGGTPAGNVIWIG